jgi:dipeptidyl aminopeptidase/acylaminoacyl peptidase
MTVPRSLIPRRALFDNPTYMDAKISPDGHWISWLAPLDTVLNIWLAPVGDLAAAQPITRTKGRPIPWHAWSPDGRFVLYSKDETGDENVHLFAVDVTTHTVRDLTPFNKINARWLIGSPDRLGEIVVGLNDRDPRWHDAYLVNLATGTRSLLWENTQELAQLGFDWMYQMRVGRSALPGGGARIWRVEAGKLEPWRDVAYEDELATWPMLFNRANTHLHFRTSVGRDTTAFTRVDWTTGAETIVAAHPRADVSNAVFDRQTFEIVAASANILTTEWFYTAPSVAPDFASLARQLPGLEFNVTDETENDRRWIVTAHKPEQPVTYLLFDRDTQQVTELFRSRPELTRHRLAPMRPVSVAARDGLELVSYLTLPADVTSAKPDKPLPMVLIVHGGPWSRDSYGYRGDHQWLADRGYAVLSVNYRGSTGFGKKFVAASIKQHAGKMHDDLIDMVEWAITEGIAERSKIAIYGGSYGGYAAFVAATFTPDVFCCAIPVVGITNLQTLIETIPPYWAAFSEAMYQSYGDPRTDEGRAFMASRSPIHKVDRITKPMLIFHGANDVRCKIAESDTIVAAMQAKGTPVIYVVYPDEGHGFAKPANRLASLAMLEAFLGQHLGGAVEPVGQDLDGSSHEIRAGDKIMTALGVT